jgi:hypothetical protein
MLRNRKEPIVAGGSWDIPPAWFGASYLVAGCLFVLCGIRGKGADPDIGTIMGRCVIGGIGLLCAGLGAWMLHLRRMMLRLASMDQLCALLHADKEILAHSARERAILPRVISNGNPYYDPADFGDAALLLRPASPPDNPQDMLLRPASGAETPSDRLLRPMVEEQPQMNANRR